MDNIISFAREISSIILSEEAIPSHNQNLNVNENNTEVFDDDHSDSNNLEENFHDPYFDFDIDGEYSYEQLLALDESTVTNGLNHKQINQYPIIKYSQKNESDVSCAICLAEYVIGDNIRTLKCNHIFHKTCIDKWLLMKIFCPFCKIDLKK